MIKHSTIAKYAKNKQALLSLDAAIESRSPLKARIDSSLTYPGHSFAFMERLEEKQPKEYHHTMDIKLDAYDDVKIKSVYKMQPRHEVNADIVVPYLEPIKVEGFLNPNLRDFQGHAEGTYGSDTYSLDTNWFLNGRPVNFASRGGVEVAYPGRRIKTEGELSRRQTNVKGSLGVQWDVNRDPSKKAILSGEATLDPAQPNFQVKAQWYPARFVDLTGTFKYDKKGWFAIKRDLEGSVRATTSFRYVNLLQLLKESSKRGGTKISKLHRHSEDNTNAWEFLQKFDLLFQDMEIIQIVDHFRGYENINFMFKHDQAKEECTTHSELSWARGQKIEYDFDLKKPNDWNDLQVIAYCLNLLHCLRINAYKI